MTPTKCYQQEKGFRWHNPIVSKSQTLNARNHHQPPKRHIPYDSNADVMLTPYKNNGNMMLTPLLAESSKLSNQYFNPYVSERYNQMWITIDFITSKLPLNTFYFLC